MFQSKAGLWVAGIAAAVVLVSVGYGMGRRAGVSISDASQALAPAGAPLPAIQIEPIQPQEELAAISAGPAAAMKTGSGAVLPATAGSGTQTAAASSGPGGVSVLPREESARVREIQNALKGAGFDPGPADGQMGQKTRTAIRDFQTAQGLEPDGKVGPRTWSRLEPFLKKQASTGD